MALSFVLDEDLRGAVWWAIQRHNLRGTDVIDVVRVGDLPDLPLGTPDPEVLVWAERAARALVTNDRNTMIGHLRNHQHAGGHTFGLFVVRPLSDLKQLVATLSLIAHAGNEQQWWDQVIYIP